MPVCSLALVVLQGESEDGSALFDGVLSLRVIREGGGDEAEGGRRGEGVCSISALVSRHSFQTDQRETNRS